MIDFKQKIEETEKQEKRATDDWDESLIANNKKRKRIVTYLIAIIVIALIFAGRVLMSSQNGTNWLTGSFFR